MTEERHEDVGGYPRHGLRTVAEAPKMWTTPDRVHEPLYALVVLTNFWRFKARWKHALRTFQHIVDSGAVLYVIEAALHERDHAVEDFAPHRVFADCGAIAPELAATCRHDDPYRGQHRYLRLRKAEDDGVWLKENLITLGRRALPADAKYFCYLDADVLFARPNWVGECLQLLQQYPVLQMFGTAHDLDAAYEVTADKGASFMAQYAAGEPMPTGYPYPGQRVVGWPGLAWAWRTEAFDLCGGIPDWCVQGGGDWHLAWALIEQADRSLRPDVHPNLRARLRWHEAQYRRHIRRKVGVMRGSVFHMHHGPKALRGYDERQALLALTQFDPVTDLRQDGQGLYHLVDDGSERFIWLRDGLRMLAQARNEDDPNT